MVASERPTNHSITSLSLSSQPSWLSTWTSILTASRSVSTRTPSQSKITNSIMRSPTHPSPAAGEPTVPHRDPPRKRCRGLGNGPSGRLQAEEPARIAFVDLRLVQVTGPHPLHGGNGVADEPWAPLWVEGEIRAEQHVIGAEEGESALHGVPGAEEGGIAIEHAEVVDGPPLEASQRPAVIRVIAPSAELIEPTTDPSLAERDHRAQVVRDDDELRMAIEESGEDQTSHRHARFVRPAEGPPEIVLRPRLPCVVRHRRRPGRVQPDRQPSLRHPGEDRLILWQIKRSPVDIAEDLHTGRAEMVEGPLQLGEGGVDVVHGQRSDEAGEAVGVTRDNGRHFVVGEPGQVWTRGRRSHHLDGRIG